MEIDFTKEEIINAIKEIDSNPDLKNIKEDSTYHLVYEGKKYPPILVLSIAQELRDGNSFTLSNFGSNPENSAIFFQNQGFDIIRKVINNKQDYIKWTKDNLDIEDSTKKQYVSSIDHLSKIVGYNIFEVDNKNQINALYQDVRKKQADKNEKYYDEQRPSYSLKGWYSASLKTYLKYLGSQPKITFLSYNFSSTFKVELFNNSITNTGLYLNQKLITRFIASLLTKPFVILTGLSGSGKTKLAQTFVQWICENEAQYRMVPVGADWTNREPLLGYPNALNPEEYVKPDSGVLDLIIHAGNHPESPHFLILDEMNLSHVERYFADFLSVMESKEEIPLHSSNEIGKEIPKRLSLPSNLFIIGTVNIDETTHMFSPKVLDRANTIEFRISEKEMSDFLKNTQPLNLSGLVAKGAGMGKSFLELAGSRAASAIDRETIDTELLRFFSELKKTGAEFGYRSATEILHLIHQLGVLDASLTTRQKLDVAIMQKLLPKLHGSRRKLCPVLEILAGFCIQDDDIQVQKDIFEKEDFDFDKALYPLSLEKITRMYKGAVDNGFASFAEA